MEVAFPLNPLMPECFASTKKQDEVANYKNHLSRGVTKQIQAEPAPSPAIARRKEVTLKTARHIHKEFAKG